MACDVTDEEAVRSLINGTVAAHGVVDLLVSNAGYVTVGGLEASDDELRRMFDVHVMAHLYAARHAIPHMVAAGGGHLLNTSSAAGLLTQIGSLHYSVTKNAAVSLAEWISVTYGHLGIEVLAEAVIEGLADGRFHILPHPDVAEYVRRKADDVDRWLGGMRRFQQRLFPDGQTPSDWLLG